MQQMIWIGGAPAGVLNIIIGRCTFNCIYVTERMLVGGSNNWDDFYLSELGGAGGGVLKPFGSLINKLN